MLRLFFHTTLGLGLAQAAVVALAAALVAALISRRGAYPQREVPLAMLRGLLQTLLVGSLLAVLLRGPWWGSAPVLVGMVLMAASTVHRRARSLPGSYAISIVCLAAGAGIVIPFMTLLGVLAPDVKLLVPVGSMVIAQSMNTQSLFFNRFLGELRSHAGEIESALALGAPSRTAVAPYIQASFHASLVPAIDNLRTLGIVWVPGLMTGMVLTGASPVYAALYQFVVLGMIYIAGGVSCLVAASLAPRRVFTLHEQLLIRGEERP